MMIRRRRRALEKREKRKGCAQMGTEDTPHFENLLIKVNGSTRVASSLESLLFHHFHISFSFPFQLSFQYQPFHTAIHSPSSESNYPSSSFRAHVRVQSRKREFYFWFVELFCYEKRYFFFNSFWKQASCSRARTFGNRPAIDSHSNGGHTQESYCSRVAVA